MKRKEVDLSINEKFINGVMIEQNVFKMLTDSDIKFEIKSDYIWKNTGNIYIEIEQNIEGRWVHSGLTVTKADYFVYVLMENDKPINQLFFETEKLKERIRKLYSLQLCKIITKDANPDNLETSTRGVLIPLKNLYISDSELEDRKKNILRRAQARQEKISPKSNGKMPD